jgi:hypothetical protein
MVLWSGIDNTLIKSVAFVKDRDKFKYMGGPLRFQIPRALCKWGLSTYNSIQVDISNQEFLDWWRDLETQLCPQVPFNSNLKLNNLRVKVDDSVYVFNEEGKQVNPDLREGLFRGQQLNILLDIDSTYFFNGSWGLTCKASQIRYYDAGAIENEEPTPPSAVLRPDVCAFLDF